MTIIYSIKLKSLLQANSFEEFARTRYLPALERGPTRLGELAGARLLRQRRVHESDSTDLDNQFLLLLEWNGITIDFPRTGDPAVQKLFDSYYAEMTRLGRFETVGTLEERAV